MFLLGAGAWTESDMKKPDQLEIENALTLAWDSLESHMLSYKPAPKRKCCQAVVGGREFHKNCIKEYAEIIKILAHLL